MNVATSNDGPVKKDYGLTGPAENVAAAFLANARMTPDSLFLRMNFGTQTTDYTYRELASEACLFNGHFRRAGLPQGSVIAIILTHSVHLYTAFLGALMAGLVPTIMPYPTPKQDRARYWQAHRELFELSKIGAVFTYAANVADIRKYLAGCVTYLSTAEDLAGCEPSEKVIHCNLAVLQHSSGTTALKKGVMLTHAAIFAQVSAYRNAIKLEPGARIASWLPLYHDMGFVACFLMPMMVGCPVVHLDPFIWSARPTILLDDIVSFGANYVWLPNFAYNHIANSLRGTKSWDLSAIQAIINCSEPCKPATFERFRTLAPLNNLKPQALQVCYAMAENVFAVSQTDLAAIPRTIHVSTASLRKGDTIVLAERDEDISPILSCGRPLAGTEVTVARDGVLDRTEMRLGEICIRGSNLYEGYYQRPATTAQRLVEGWHHSGDVGFVCDGEVYVTGRLDDLLIVRGRNIYAHEIEEAINSLGLVIPGRAVALTDFETTRGEATLVVMAESEDISRMKEIAAAARGLVMDQFGVSISDFRLLPPLTLRKTTSGKLSRVANSELYSELKRD